MIRLLLLLIERATPRADREWVVGDTLEELDRIERSAGRSAARRWLAGELWRVAIDAPGHRRTARSLHDRPLRASGGGPMQSILQDLRYGWRLLRRAPSFAAVAILTLAVGIGANTAMFAVVNAVLLRPLPFPDGERLMLVHLTAPAGPSQGAFREVTWSYPKYQTFLTAQDVFDETALFAGREVNLSGESDPERVRAELITERYLPMLGIQPHIGRTFTTEEAHSANAEPVALIGYGLWTRRFGADPAAVGRIVHVDSIPYTIAGILPRGFTGLNGDAEVWVPLGTFAPFTVAPEAAQAHWYRLLARRTAGIADDAAIAAVRVAGSRVAAAHPLGNGAAWGATARTLHASRVDADLRLGAILLLGAVGCVLLIACVNLTNLAGTRAIARGREIGVRLALGATRSRIVRQLLAEGAVLSAAGAAAGILLAWMLLRIAAVLLPDADVFFETPVAPGTARMAGAAGLTRIGAAMIGLDIVTLAFAAALGLATAVLVSLMPALRVSAVRPGLVLKAGGWWGRGQLRALSTRGALVTAQIALAVILLAGAGLMLRSAVQLYATSVGVTADRVLTIGLDLPQPRYTDTTARSLFQQLLDRVRAVPGIESAAFGSCPPVSGGCNQTILWYPPGPAVPGRDPFVGMHWITPGLLSTLGMELRSGRDFTDADRAGRPKVALVNEAAVRLLWPNEPPLGRRIAVGQGGFADGAEIVGVVSNVRYDAIDIAPVPTVYIPLGQSFQPGVTLFVRSALAAEEVVAGVARELRALDPALPLGEVRTMQQRIDDAMWRTRVGAWLLSAFAALALLLTSIGIFGVMAQTVSQCTADIGIRIALGAQRRDVLSLVLGRAALVTGVGLALGVLGALGLTRAIAVLLYGVEPHDPATLGLAAGVLGCVALAASYIPARRATRVDAMVALRAE